MYRNADLEKTQPPPTDDYRLKQARDQYADRGTQASTSCEPSSEQIVAEFFKYHTPNDFTIPKYAAINQAAKKFAEVVLQNCPSGADRSAAIRLIRDARMTANAAVALNGLSL